LVNSLDVVIPSIAVITFLLKKIRTTDLNGLMLYLDKQYMIFLLTKSNSILEKSRQVYLKKAVSDLESGKIAKKVKDTFLCTQNHFGVMYGFIIAFNFLIDTGF
jgi:hypothetical protein